jgi:hypothetical protein
MIRSAGQSGLANGTRHLELGRKTAGLQERWSVNLAHPEPEAAMGPLSGIRVLDFTMYQQGLRDRASDMGAEIIKVEPPGGGEPGRRALSGRPVRGLFRRL